MVEITLSEEKLLDGERFSTGYLWTAVGNGSTVNFIIINPADSDTGILLDPIRVGVTSRFTVQKHRNRTASSTGTATSVVNKNFSSEKTSIVEVYHTNTLNADGEAFNAEVIGSSNNVGGSGFVGADYLGPGDSLVIELTNEGSGGEAASIDINYVEINR